MAEDRPVTVELHHEIEQFLFHEARLLDSVRYREWFEQMIDPEISYQLAIGEERFSKDSSTGQPSEARPYDDDHKTLDRRVKQVESGRRTMLDPPERLRRYVTNLSAFHGSAEGTYRVLSYGMVTRNRRMTEREQIEYGRQDLLRRGPDGALRILSRRIEVDQRVIQGKNLLFFL